MASFLLTWNPAKYPRGWEEFGDSWRRYQRGENPTCQWSCGGTKRIFPGDLLFHLRQGAEPRGVFAIWRAIEQAFEDWHFDDSSRTTTYVRAESIALCDPRSPAIGRTLLNSRPFNVVNWNTQRSGIKIPDHVSNRLVELWNECSSCQIFSTPDEAAIHDVFYEGARQLIVVNAYERNPAARKACIQYHGTRCAACEQVMEDAYGYAAKDIIHVHHLKPISTAQGEYELDPVHDLVPVCPNCHAVIHARRDKPYEVAEVRRMIMKRRRLSRLQ